MTRSSGQIEDVSVTLSSKVHVLIYLSAAIFITILQLSGWMDSSIRTLHMWQSAIYIVIIILCVRRSILGYGAGIGIAAFWNTANLFVTNFAKSGWTVLVRMLQGQSNPHPELIIAPIAVAAHFILIGACVYSYLVRPARRKMDLVLLLISAASTVFIFFLIISAWGPQYLHIFSTMISWFGVRVR